VRAELAKRKTVTWAKLLGRVAEGWRQTGKRPFDFVVVDEAQDVDIAELRFLAALCGGHSDGLFFAATSGQRIFQQPFSWRLKA
jgi:superfamily I DNA/RNA helicase